KTRPAGSAIARVPLCGSIRSILPSHLVGPRWLPSSSALPAPLSNVSHPREDRALTFNPAKPGKGNVVAKYRKLVGCCHIQDLPAVLGSFGTIHVNAGLPVWMGKGDVRILQGICGDEQFV